MRDAGRPPLDPIHAGLVGLAAVACMALGGLMLWPVAWAVVWGGWSELLSPAPFIAGWPLLVISGIAMLRELAAYRRACVFPGLAVILGTWGVAGELLDPRASGNVGLSPYPFMFGLVTVVAFGALVTAKRTRTT